MYVYVHCTYTYIFIKMEKENAEYNNFPIKPTLYFSIFYGFLLFIFFIRKKGNPYFINVFNIKVHTFLMFQPSLLCNI